MKIGVFILMRGPGKTIRHYYENRSFPYFCVALPKTSVILAAAGIQSPFHVQWRLR